MVWYGELLCFLFFTFAKNLVCLCSYILCFVFFHRLFCVLCIAYLVFCASRILCCVFVSIEAFWSAGKSETRFAPFEAVCMSCVSCVLYFVHCLSCILCFVFCTLSVVYLVFCILFIVYRVSCVLCCVFVFWSAGKSETRFAP